MTGCNIAEEKSQNKSITAVLILEMVTSCLHPSTKAEWWQVIRAEEYRSKESNIQIAREEKEDC